MTVCRRLSVVAVLVWLPLQMHESPRVLKDRDRALTRFGIRIFLGLLVGVPGLIVAATFVGAILRSPLTWSDMDWNADGRSSLLEAVESTDVGVRPRWQDGRACEEFFSMKDGLSLRIRCR